MCNNVTKAVEAIRKLESSDQINQIIDAIKLQQTYVARNAARSVQVGTLVTFEGRRGNTVTGEVLKVNQKTIVVRDSATMAKWKVTASMVSPI
jgi:exosome complex RNA-binding protein Csl4